ncbi:MAG: ATP-dependent DNA helicase RecG [Erysipelotrichaceae bacterium]
MELSKLKISDKKIAVLKQMGINCVEDLLIHYPFRYEQIEIIPYQQWMKDSKICVEGIIISQARIIRFGYHRSVTKFKISFEDHELEISLFNRPWIQYFKMGTSITIIGKYDGKDRITANQYNFKPLKDQLGIEPIYNVKEGISQKDIRKYIDKAYVLLKDDIKDFIPEVIRIKYRLIHRECALYNIHHPHDYESLKQSLRHLKYEEFFKFQFTMQALKQMQSNTTMNAGKTFDVGEVMKLNNTLSFQLTKDQYETIQDILSDMKSDKIMYRMVQGDVGCGKTLVAAFAMYACVLSHKQAAFMAPTEILAKQHRDNLKELFRDYDVEVEVLYSSLKPSKKKEILKRLKNNEIDLIIGTHALFQEEVTFDDLGLVVTDEQHRFGVEQRRKLIAKGDKVDFLLMSATPIPRTLALSLYGDMDVSTVTQLPRGRRAKITKLVKENTMNSFLPFLLEKLDEGDQCFVVCPAIEKNEDYPVRNVNDIYDAMNQTLGKKYKIGLLHGKMSSEEKDEVMQEFVDHKINILVATTVIEVGVDVKDANLMVIYDADRFGLSQIHQLRGRIGRGNRDGYCYLLTNSKDADALKRLSIIESSDDGFYIATADLQIRGPGDILGNRQSGIPGFILGDVIADANILQVARDDAIDVLKHLDEKAYEDLKKYRDEQISSTTYLD